MSRRDANIAEADTTDETQVAAASSKPRFFDRRGVVFIEWCIAIALLLIAGLHVCCHDGLPILACINAFTRYIYLPAYLCLALAMWNRRWLLAGISAIVVACHVMWVAPDFMPGTADNIRLSEANANSSANRVRIFYANVRATNTEFGPLLDEIKAANPDIIIGVEFAWHWREAFWQAGMVEKYPYNNVLKTGEWDQVFYYSRLRVQKDVDERVTTRTVVSLNIPVGNGELNLVALHSLRPTQLLGDDYQSYWNQVLPLIEKAPRPLVVLGDFNATQYSRVYQQVKELGLRNAHEDRGRGYVTTWPNGAEPIPPIRIDQVFLSPEIRCIDVVEGVGQGSDHKPLILDIEVPARP